MGIPPSLSHHTSEQDEARHCILLVATAAFAKKEKKHHRGRRDVLQFDINLDLAPEERFTEVVTHFEPQIHDLFLFLTKIPAVTKFFSEIARLRGPENDEYNAEIEGIAKITKIDPKLVQAAQYLYELNTLMVPIINFST